MGRAPCCDKANVKKGPWSPEEDAKLKEYIEKYGTGGNWIALPQKVGLKRCGKSCRLRWLNYLRPNIKHGEFSDEEDRIICTLYSNIGSRWSIIAAQLPGRTDNDIKNYWNTKLKKKLMSLVHNNNIPSYPNNTIPQRNRILFSNNNIPPFLTSSDHHNHYQPLFHYSTALSSLSTTYSPSYTTMNSGSRSSYDHYNNLINFQSNNNNSLSDHWGHSSGNPNVVMFGSSSTTPNEGSICSTSSEGSCNYQIKQEEIFHGFQNRQASQTSFVGLLSNRNNYGGGYNGNNNVVGDDGSKVNLMWGQKSTSGCFGLDDGQVDHDYQYYYPSSSSSSCVSEDHVNKQVNNNYFMSFFNV